MTRRRASPLPNPAANELLMIRAYLVEVQEAIEAARETLKAQPRPDHSLSLITMEEAIRIIKFIPFAPPK